jgi:hypothetical protein
VIKNLLFNIFPGAESIFTLLIREWKKDISEEILKLSHPVVDGKSTLKYYTPVVPNFEEKTFVHLVYEIPMFKTTLNLVMDKLSLYEFHHHSKQIKNILAGIIGKEVDSVQTYLDSRVLQDKEIEGEFGYSMPSSFSGAIDAEIGYNDDEIDKRFEELGGGDYI